MRVLAAWILALGLVAPPVVAGTGIPGDETSTATKAEADKDAAAKKTGDGATAASKSDAPTKTESASMEAELQQLRDLLETQAKQLQEQNEQLKEQQKKMQQLEEQLNSASTSHGVAAGTAAVTGESTSSAASANVITRGVTNTTTNSATNSGSSTPAQEMNDEPLAIHFKGITLAPGGFTAAETSWRSKALSADVNTPFNTIPMPGASNSNVSEFNLTGRQSRISMLIEGKLSNVKIGGYYEGDFLGGGSTSNNNQSNSYVFRQRQFWGQAAFDSGFTVTGGQMWSLVTQTAHGMDNRTEVLPLTIDAQYHVGFSWARQYGLRLTQNFGNKFWLGFSIEDPETTFKVHGNPTTTTTSGATTVLVPCTGTATPPCTASVGGTSTTFTNFLLGASGAAGGLFNPLANYSYNPAPDLIFKAVAEPGFGHYEIFGVYSRFRDSVFPCEYSPLAPTTCPTTPSAYLAYNDSRNGGGVGGNLWWNLFNKHLDFGLHGIGGNGIGRYGSGGLSDATIRPDGTIALLKNYQVLGTIVLHPVPKLDIYLNGGGEYASKAAYSYISNTKTGAITQEGYGNPAFANSGCYTPAGPTTTTPVGTTAGAGYVPGTPGNCTGDPRNIFEGTLGFWYRFYQGPKGRMQFGAQYSYVDLNTWRGTAAPNGVTAPHTDENMWFTSLRYYLP
jgi:TolA-binding protein